MTGPDVDATGVFVDDLLGHARRDPGAAAVVTGEGTCTYGELAERVRALAATLTGHEAAPERVCAVALERGLDAVTAVAAVAAAGAAFLTLDVELPPARLAALAASAGVELVITRPGPGRFDPPPGATVLPVAPGGPVVPQWRDPLPVDPRSLAYVSHTSGSTGDPNPVLVEHRGLHGYLRSVAAEHGLGPGDTVLQVAPFGYDASIRDVFATLGAGARLVVLPRELVLQPAGFAAAVSGHGVTALLSATPTLLTHLAADPASAAALAGLRLVLTSGESLRPFLAAGGRSLVPGRLVNQYGPTEATMTSTRHVVAARPDAGADLIGSALPGVTARVVGPDLGELPAGAVGEVLLGGAGIARGYRGRPGLTADRFVPDPAGPPGARAYRTGDLARRYGADGPLEYLGRGDRQLKIRGHRVDPGEIEGTLLRHPAVTAAAVTPAVDGRGRDYLVAHVAGVPAAVSDRDLRAHLARTLAPHMLPRRIERLDRLPTTSSGKTDRRALAPVGRAR